MLQYQQYFLCVVVLQSFVIGSDSVLLNTVTGRCLHIGSKNESQSYTAFTKECSWNKMERGKDGGDPDQWLELTRFVHRGKDEVMIRKIESESLICMLREGIHVTAGKCALPGSIFSLTPVKAKESENEYRLENPKGTCLTVVPGTPQLRLRNCTLPGFFQRWKVCRHVHRCDVDALWSPSQIIFQAGHRKVERDRHINKTMMTTKKPEILTIMEVVSEKPNGKKIEISEILYFLQNEAKYKHMGRETESLTATVSSFYNDTEIEDGIRVLIKICNERSLEGFIFNEKVESSLWDEQYHHKSRANFLVNLFNKLHQKKKLSGFTFVAENGDRIPENPSATLAVRIIANGKDKIAESIDSLINKLSQFKQDLNREFMDMKGSGISSPEKQLAQTESIENLKNPYEISTESQVDPLDKDDSISFNNGDQESVESNQEAAANITDIINIRIEAA